MEETSREIQELDVSGLEVILYDIGGTLISEDTINSQEGKEVARGNCLQYLTEEPKLPILEELTQILTEAKKRNIPQGVISGYAYQFGMNYISASAAREFINPQLIFLAHKYAWEAMVLDGKDYAAVLKEYDKPSVKMFENAREKVSELKGKQILPQNCLFVGDSLEDRTGAERAGWKYVDVNKQKATQ